MTQGFEQLPIVYQAETLVHVKWFGERGIQTPYTIQTLENDLKQQAVRIWQEETYDQNEILKNLSSDNNRRVWVEGVLERLLRYKKTLQFEDGMDVHYRDKKLMNDIYKNQFDKLKGLSFVIFPNNPYNFTELKAEITKMKIQELAPQLRNEKTKLEQLITDAKNKVEANFTVIIDQLLELQQQIIKKEKNSN